MRYLSEQWFAAADQAVRDQAHAAPVARLVIDQHVGEHVRYRIVIAKDDASIQSLRPGAEQSPADATFRQGLDTATAIAQGTTDAHQAFLLGHINFEGDVNVLIERRASFDWLAQALAPVLAETTYST